MFEQFFTDLHKEQIITECIKHLNAYYDGDFMYLRGGENSTSDPVFTIWKGCDDMLKWEFTGTYLNCDTHTVCDVTVYGLVTTLNGGQYRSYAHEIGSDIYKTLKGGQHNAL